MRDLDWSDVVADGERMDGSDSTQGGKIMDERIEFKVNDTLYGWVESVGAGDDVAWLAYHRVAYGFEPVPGSFTDLAAALAVLRGELHEPAHTAGELRALLAELPDDAPIAISAHGDTWPVRLLPALDAGDAITLIEPATWG